MKMKKLISIILSLLIFVISIPSYPNNLYAANSQQIYIIKDLETEHFIKKLITPIILAAGLNPRSIKIYIINDETPNAFVYAGQNIFIHTGLITFADSYNEIAGVLAHELGHIAAGHLSRSDTVYKNASLLVLASLAAFLLTIPFLNNNSTNSSDNVADLVGFITYGSQFFAQSAILSYSRSEESQADQLGAYYISQTNYSLDGLYNFMKKLYNMENKKIYTANFYAWYSSHPLTKTRMQFLENYKKEHQKKYVENKNLTYEFNKVKSKLLAFSVSQTYYNNSNFSEFKNNSLYFQAIMNYKNSNYKQSLQLLDILLNQHYDVYTLELKSDILCEQNIFNLCSEGYQKIFDSTHNELIAYKLSKALLAQGKYKPAEKYIDISLSIDSQNPSGWQIKSIIMGQQNKLGEANLALAEKYWILQNYKKSKMFAYKALGYLTPNSKEYLQAQDILDQK